jgi:hypothetical protein
VAAEVLAEYFRRGEPGYVSDEQIQAVSRGLAEEISRRIVEEHLKESMKKG